MEGGAHARFPSTCWAVIRDAQAGAAAQRAAALERLLSVYWRPIYWTIRLDWNEPPEEARDLTQGYCAAFLERDLLHDVAAERGRFRSFVKATLKHWMLAHRRDASAQKRGGGVRIVALADLDPVEADPPDAGQSPEQRFERQLMRAILGQALSELRAACEREGKQDHFELFHRFYVLEASGVAPSYADLAAGFALSLHDVKNRLATLRGRFRNLVLGYLRDGLSSDADLISEVRAVFTS